ncbi:MAG TPA: hypothetical protein VFD70_20380 [Anaerolineae bacterium]|nr:hypothetical protein [Anaerolineae bacterium]
MKRGWAIGFGAATILAALWVGANPLRQDATPQPIEAQALATVLHQTTTPRPSPTAIPTPVHLTSHNPSDGEILSLLSQSSDRGVFIRIAHPVKLQRFNAIDYGTERIIVTGDNVLASNGKWEIPAAFGAILTWDQDEYRLSFLRIEHGDTTARVEPQIESGGQVIFNFYDMGRSGRNDPQAQRSVIVLLCNNEPRVTVRYGWEQSDENLAITHCT